MQHSVKVRFRNTLFMLPDCFPFSEIKRERQPPSPDDVIVLSDNEPSSPLMNGHCFTKTDTEKLMVGKLQRQFAGCCHGLFRIGRVTYSISVFLLSYAEEFSQRARANHQTAQRRATTPRSQVGAA